MAVSSATVRSIVSDGTNLFLEVEVYNGDRTLPLLRPTFPVGTTASEIQTYLQTIANNRPSITQDIAELINARIAGS